MTPDNNRRAFHKMRGRALWWVLAAVVLLAIYFVVFRPREAADAPDVPPVPAEPQQQTAPN